MVEAIAWQIYLGESTQIPFLKGGMRCMDFATICMSGPSKMADTFSTPTSQVSDFATSRLPDSAERQQVRQQGPVCELHLGEAELGAQRKMRSSAAVTLRCVVFFTNRITQNGGVPMRREVAIVKNQSLHPRKPWGASCNQRVAWSFTRKTRRK